MKKIIATIVILVVCFTCITACGTKQEEVSIPETNTIEVSSEVSATEPDVAEVSTEGYMTNKNICTQDEYEQTLFGQPISEERNGEIRLGIKCTHDIYAELTVYEAKGGKYVPIFECDALIGKNGPGKHAQEDAKTPLGTWIIGEAYGIKENPGSLLPYTQVTDDMYWCATGNHTTKYNQLIYKSDEPGADYSEDEHLMDYPTRYAYFIDLGYNVGCAPYAGNAIFLEVWEEIDHPTSGGVAVAEENMVEILKLLPVGTVVTIY